MAAGVLQFTNPTVASAASRVQAVVVTSAAGTAARSMTVTCPSGTVAVGGLAVTLPALAHVDQIWPSTQSVTFHATPLSGLSGAWLLRATALCTARPAGLQYVNGPTVTVNRSVDDDQRYGKISFAECPANKELIGLGATAVGGYLSLITPEGPHVPYTSMRGDHLYGVTVTGSAYPESPAGTVRARAVCADRGLNSVVGVNEAVVTRTSSTLTAACPAGTELHAVGMHPMYPNHYDDLSPISFVLPVRLDAPTTALTSGRVTVRKHIDTIPVEQWYHVALSLCA